MSIGIGLNGFGRMGRLGFRAAWGADDIEVIRDIVAAVSCTTNCLARVVRFINEKLGIAHGLITTLHNVTNTQIVVDAQHKDFRNARPVLNSLIPTTTGLGIATTMTLWKRPS